MAINSLTFTQPQAYSGGADFSMLANLGNVYREAQDRQRKLEALSSLGTDPQANIRTLLTSSDPALAQLGLSLQQKDIERAREDVRYGVTDKRANALLGIQQAAERRAQGTYEQEQADRDALAKIIGGLGGTAPPAATPFPAPLPTPQAAPQAAPQAPTPQAPPPQAPSAFEATPRLPAELQAPPQQPRVKAEDEETGLPSWAADPSGLASRTVANLTSGQPAAAAGINREQLGAMYANPLTRPLATALLQKQMDPGTWTYQQVGDKLYALNSRGGPPKLIVEDTKPFMVGEHALIRDANSPTGFRDIAPPSQKPVSKKEGEQLFVADPAAPGGYREIGGGDNESKLQREIRQRTEAATAAGYSKEDANFYGLNAKLPKEDLSPSQQKRVDTLTDQSRKADATLQNIAQMKQLSKGAWGFRGAGPASLAATTVLPNSLATATGAVDTQDLINAANYNVVTMAKATFPQRVTNMDVKLLQDLEGSANQPDVVRQKILDRAEKVFTQIAKEDREEAEGIINRTRYKPGATPQATSPTSALQWKIIK